MDKKVFVSGNVTINTKEMGGKKVLSLSDVRTLTNKTAACILSAFHRKEKDMVKGNHYFHISGEEMRKLEPKKYNYPHGAFLLTKSGCNLVLKSVRDISEDELNTFEDYYKEEETAIVEAKEKLPDNAAEETKAENVTPEIAECNKFDSNIVKELIDLFGKSIEYQNRQLELERKRNEDFRQMMDESFRMMNAFIAIMTKNGKSPNVNIEYKCENLNDLELSQDYRNWRRDILDYAMKVYEDSVPGTFKNRNAVLSTAYKRMQAEYGVCWDQLKKDFRNDNNMCHKDTLELAYYMEHSNPACKGLLKAKLNTIYNETKVVSA